MGRVLGMHDGTVFYVSKVSYEESLKPDSGVGYDATKFSNGVVFFCFGHMGM